eukprot:g3446.t1
MLFLSRPLMFNPTLSPGLAKSTRWWCISTVKTFPLQGLLVVCVGRKTTWPKLIGSVLRDESGWSSTKGWRGNSSK